jgi:segregation and condensation protein B
MQENLNNIIESLLFVSEEPLTVEKFKQILETVDTKEIRSALQSLVEEYEARGGGFKLAEVAGGWQLRSRPQYNKWLKRMLQPSPQRLSKAALETLAIIAYNQPIIRADIEHIRGVDAGGVLRQLLERKLIRVLGRKEIPGRPLIYATTKLFLELFELKDLKDLPSPKEIEEMSAAAEPEPIVPLSEIDKRPTFETADNETDAQPPPPYEETTNYRVTVVMRQHMRSPSHPKRPGASKSSPIIKGHKSIISSTPFKLPGERWEISIRPNNLKKP